MPRRGVRFRKGDDTNEFSLSELERLLKKIARGVIEAVKEVCIEGHEDNYKSQLLCLERFKYKDIFEIAEEVRSYLRGVSWGEVERAMEMYEYYSNLGNELRDVREYAETLMNWYSGGAEGVLEEMRISISQYWIDYLVSEEAYDTCISRCKEECPDKDDWKCFHQCHTSCCEEECEKRCEGYKECEEYCQNMCEDIVD
jgi:hypothetical protein